MDEIRAKRAARMSKAEESDADEEQLTALFASKKKKLSIEDLDGDDILDQLKN
jgi:hypothetical protein